MKIISNNPKVIAYATVNSLEIIKAVSLPEVLKNARDMVHKNHKLINHPLVTSIKPYSNLYKTIVLIEESSLDYQSLDIMENSIAKAQQFQKEVPINEQAKEDYQTIDFGVFKQSIEKI
ncbi:GrdX family protein [Alkalicella caledoniensis]|uniref:GrdX family protein n=1 Tax=Alkalicella caledoniensis TaxID=2731377 RepID=A0A7G9W941_ALKCA|nr:GrdX family protein [Alkalicella caledoniensis]QNO15203.1 GrdX family protein [Alkalicella caledoniensis]